jgi:hypothetical protein
LVPVSTCRWYSCEGQKRCDAGLVAFGTISKEEVTDDQPKFKGCDLASYSRSSNFPSLRILRLRVIEIVLEDFEVQVGLSGRGEAMTLDEIKSDLNHRANTASHLRRYMLSHVTSMFRSLASCCRQRILPIGILFSLGPSCRHLILKPNSTLRAAGVTPPLKTTQILSLTLTTVRNRRSIAAGKIEIFSPDASRDGCWTL